MHPSLVRRLEQADRKLTRWMGHWGHRLDRWGLGLFFMWLGSLEILGFKSATSLIAHTVYILPPATAVPLLGAWPAWSSPAPSMTSGPTTTSPRRARGRRDPARGPRDQTIM